MSWTTQLRAQRDTAAAAEQSTKPLQPTMRDTLRRLRGRPGPHGTEWVTSEEIANRLGLTPADRLRPVMRKAHDAMRSLGWKPAQVGTRGLRRRGFVRPVPLADADPAPPKHHGAAVEAFRVTLDRLAAYGLSSAQLDRAYDDARDAG